MSSTYMVFRCIFTIINMCFFVSERDIKKKEFIELKRFFFLGVGIRDCRLQLVVAYQVSGLSAINGESVAYSACRLDYFRLVLRC